MSSRCEEGIAVQRGCRVSTMSSHSVRAARGDAEVRRWAKRVRRGRVDGVVGMRRTRRPVEEGK